MKDYRFITGPLLIVLCIMSCTHRTSHELNVAHAPRTKPALELMRFTIQAGAFKNPENAARLSDKLTKDHGLDATYFLASDKLFKVRFGNFATKESARQRAVYLQRKKVIDEFYIVRPEDYSIARQKQYGTEYLREALVKTAKDFIGVPYLWGGTSPDDGFDCSGLTMTVYQLNGLNLPRNSTRQYEAGNTIGKSSLQKGDLVFFSLKPNSGVTHVGIFIGDGYFIHASSQGGKIRIDSLASTYFTAHYVGSKTYF